MAYVPSAIAARNLAFHPAPARSGPGLWRRLLAAMTASRQRQLEQEIARYLDDAGGKFTDEAEREIERRFLSMPSRW